MQQQLLRYKQQVAPGWTATLDGPCRDVPWPGESRGEAWGAVAVENRLLGQHDVDRTEIRPTVHAIRVGNYAR